MGPTSPALSADISMDFNRVLPGLYVTCAFGVFSLLKELFFWGGLRIFVLKTTRILQKAVLREKINDESNLQNFLC